MKANVHKSSSGSAYRLSASFLHIVLMFVVLSAALTGEAIAAPQSPVSSSGVQLASAPDSCELNPTWVWAYGPSRPDLASQAELALKRKGIESRVTASEYGEMDSCGNFEPFSVDFKVTIQSTSNPGTSANERSGLGESILAILSDVPGSKLGNVQVDFGSGETKRYTSPVDPSLDLPVAASSFGAESTAQTTNKKVFLLVFNPTLSNGQDLNTYMGWTPVSVLVEGVIASFQIASQGRLQYTVVDTQLVSNEWPIKIDGFRYTETTYLDVMQRGIPAHSPDEVDYNVIIDNPAWDICGKLNRGEIDELWMYGAPYFGFYESRLVGPGAYRYNSSPMSGTHNCNKLLPIMGLSYERGVAEAVHSFGHRAEASMTKVYGDWQENRTNHNWDRFGLVQAQSPNYTYSGCGSIHYPPNALSAYEYGNSSNSTLTNCNDFVNYPDLSDPLAVAQPVTCTAWDCDHLQYLIYWFGHLPANAGCGPDVVENNWWSYFIDPNVALYPPLNCPVVPPGPILPGDTVRVSVNSAGGQALSSSSDSSQLSADGRYVVFGSSASNLVPGDTNGASDVFIRDLQTGVTTRASVNSNGMQGNNHSTDPAISANGRYVVFYSSASNLVADDTNEVGDIFLHDKQTSVTSRISMASNDTQANGFSYSPSISADGRYVTFMTYASNLVAGDTNGTSDVVVRDTHSGTTVRVSIASDGTQANGPSSTASISADGRYVTYHSQASNLVSGDTNTNYDIFVRDTQADTTTRVSVNSSAEQASGGSVNPSISADGRYVVFESNAANLVSGDTNGEYDIFIRDTHAGITMRASVNSNGGQGNRLSTGASISADGRYVTFYSNATNLVTGDTNQVNDIFVRDVQLGLTTRVSVSSNATQANNYADTPFISADGQYIVFRSVATNLVVGDTNSQTDVFVHRQAGPLVPTETPTHTPTGTPTDTATATATYTPTTTAAVFTLVLQPDAAAGMDSYIYSGGKNTNYGTAVAMGVGEDNTASNRIARALLKFDLSSIPANATITSATLSLWPSADLSSNTRMIRVYRLRVPFNESQVTWTVSATGLNWQSAGASGTNDRESVEIGSVTILENEALNIEKQIVLMPAKIQEMVNGTFLNRGFIVVADTELNDRFNYQTSDSATTNQRPKLVIQYTLASGEPSITPSVSPTPTFTLTATASPTATMTPSQTFTPSITPTFTPTASQTPTSFGPPSITPSITPSSTYTPTATHTLSPTPSQTPTLTATAASGFPFTTVLDNFNRANGAPGKKWGGTTAGYSIVSSRLDVGTGGDVFWKVAAFGADQEVFVTINNIDTAGSELSLLLKSQSSTTWSSGVIKVLYDPIAHTVQVWTYSSAQGWVQRGTDLSVIFANGDQFGARARSNGMIEMYRNGVLLGSRDASGWTYSGSGGYAGLWFINAGNSLLDDFGGGTIAP